jgi:hypothetical protein
MTTTPTETALERAERRHLEALEAYESGRRMGIARNELLEAEKRLARARKAAKVKG